MVNTQLKILRVFGPTSAEVSAVLRQARDDGCPGLRLLERDGEFAVCVQVSAPNRAMAEQYCDKWVQKLQAKFGDDVFATGETSLAQATLDLLLQKRKLLVAVDETTGRLLTNLLQPLDHSEAVFDFGTESYANAQRERQIKVPPQVLKKFPGDVVQAAAARAVSAMQVTGADFAAAYMPATVGQCPFVLVCDRHGAAACALPPELSDAAIGNQILDLLRRRLQGLRLTDSCITFRPGRERPMLIVSEAGRERGNTVRFSLRRRTPATHETDHTADFEPMMDFDTAEPQMPPAAQPVSATRTLHTQPLRQAASADTTVPVGTIQFETDLPRQPEPNTDPATIETAGPQAARASRQRRAAAEPMASSYSDSPAPRGGQTGSLLDEDVPDFSAQIDPEALAAAQAADEADAAAGRTTTAEEFSRAATRLFSEEDEAELAAAQAKTGRRPKKAGAPRREAPEPSPAASIRNRSLAMIERAERRRRRTVTGILIFLVLLVLAGAVGLWWFFRHDLGTQPAAKNYGTTLYDETAQKYLTQALEKRPGAVGYLGWPGLDGSLVYAAGTEPKTRSDGTQEAITRFATANALPLTTPGNTVLECTGSTYAALAQQDTIQENSGFTLYLADGTYRFKVLAVYYLDPSEEGEGAFDLYGSTDLSNYYDYLSFVAGIQARSLWETGVEVGDRSHFLTLTCQAEEDGVLLCVTGRMIEEEESAALDGASITATEEPLLTALQYQRKNQPMPTVSTLLSASVDRYAQQSAAGAAKRNEGQASEEETADSSDLSAQVGDMQAQTDALLASTDKLLAGLTDLAGSSNETESDLSQGAEGSLPQQTVTVEQVTATPAPTETPVPTEVPPESSSSGAASDSTSSTAPSDSSSATPAPDSSTPAPDSGNNSSGNTGGETINVTMNGTAQTMDLVQCLAMVAQNELGSNAPAEAYKAQCVATHCWSLSQSGYPSVYGTTPGAAALAAAQEVARVLVTYNGQVCFTPYFASASTGTASAADVWGNDIAWLQAVDSPYDQSVASNWNTNGNSSGTARFARQTLLERIKSELEIDLTDVDPNNWFKIISTNQYGWVSKIQVGPDGNSVTVSGRWFRENLLARQSVDGRSLRSQCFTFSYDGNLDCFIFDVYGYGHGCGMSQWGAVGYARNGWSYQDILQHYYPGTTLTTY